MALHDSKTADQFGFDNMRGSTVKNVGKPIQKNDALTWALPPYTTTLRDAIPNPYKGMIIINTTTNKLNFYTGAAWEAVTSA